MRASAGRSCLLRMTSVAVLTMLVWTVGSTTPRPGTAAHAAEACKEKGGDPADERRLKDVSKRRTQIQADLDELFNAGHVLRAKIRETDEQHATLVARQRKFDEQAGAARTQLADRVRRSYMLTNADPVLTMLSATDASNVVEQSRLLGLLAEGSRAHVERASSAAQRNAAAAEQAAEVADLLARMRNEYGQVKKRTERLLADAEQEEAKLSAKVALQRAANGSGCPLPPGLVAGGLACPVDQPRSFTDSYGAPRSGGRGHQGVDILAPMRTPIRAYEDGTITRMNNSSLGGISLYMRGASGNEYYYTHMSGYVSGLATGQRVSAGQHIAFIGDTGNAAGIPHLHWEVRPGGGGNVNPYPYAKTACG